MPTHRSTRTRRCVLAIALLALAAAASTGCGVGPATDEEKISKTATTYLHALADGDTATACAQLTRRAQGDRCQAALKERLPRLRPDALRSAADGSIDIDVDGDSATARLTEPEGARLTLAPVGAEWRIDSGYTLSSAMASIPATPVGKQITWALARLNGRATTLNTADLSARFSPEFLAVVMPARELAASLRRTAAERGPFTLTGFAHPPTATQAIALIKTKTGERGSLRIEVDASEQARIIRFEVTAPPPAIATAGRYSGRFDIGGRELFLHCTGSGSPTVVFQGGLTTDWVQVQARVARFTRACSYDPANGPWGRSDPAPTPRTGQDYVADLRALLTAAKVPGPYVITSHSNGGLFAQLYAAKHPHEIAGLVLLDAVHKNYHARRIALLKKLLPAAELKANIRALRTALPAILDPEQIDLETSLAQTRAALASAPLRPMPLSVITHGRPEPGSDPRTTEPDERLWRKLQDEIAALVANGKHAIARRSGHDIHHQQPELVNAAIREVVEAVRRPTTWTTP
jgi:pimeloyl-ACP methyl ester carboxylesterase